MQMDTLISHLNKFRKFKLYFIGDFNVVLLKDSSDSILFYNYISSHDLKFLNDLSTRLHACLDNVITNSDTVELVCEVTNFEISDHRGLLLGIVCSGRLDAKIAQSFYVRSLGLRNIQLLRNRL